MQNCEFLSNGCHIVWKYFVNNSALRLTLWWSEFIREQIALWVSEPHTLTTQARTDWAEATSCSDPKLTPAHSIISHNWFLTARLTMKKLLLISYQFFKIHNCPSSLRCWYYISQKRDIIFFNWIIYQDVYDVAYQLAANSSPILDQNCPGHPMRMHSAPCHDFLEGVSCINCNLKINYFNTLQIISKFSKHNNF